jgi:hypothetical protein
MHSHPLIMYSLLLYCIFIRSILARDFTSGGCSLPVVVKQWMNALPDRTVELLKKIPSREVFTTAGAQVSLFDILDVGIKHEELTLFGFRLIIHELLTQKRSLQC